MDELEKKYNPHTLWVLHQFNKLKEGDKMFVTYCLEKKVEGEWCLWGKYTDIDSIARAAFQLGRRAGLVEDVRIREQEEPWEKKSINFVSGAEEN